MSPVHQEKASRGSFYEQKGKAHGATLLAVACHGSDGTVGNYQVESRNVPGVPARACAMGLDHWGVTFGTVSDCPGKLSFLVLGCGMLTRMIVWCSGCTTIPAQTNAQG
jgi:hypothetical protein